MCWAMVSNLGCMLSTCWCAWHLDLHGRGDLDQPWIVKWGEVAFCLNFIWWTWTLLSKGYFMCCLLVAHAWSKRLDSVICWYGCFPKRTPRLRFGYKQQMCGLIMDWVGECFWAARLHLGEYVLLCMAFGSTVCDCVFVCILWT